MPIIFATGMNSRELHSQFANDHHISVLEKPFEASILLDELSRHGLPRCA
jgi:hypothetical protein